LQAGKHVVTANKELLALRSAEIFARAAMAGKCLGFEASCVGGVPIIGALRTGLAANRIDALFGIVNGTCNYILTEMLAARKPYAAALAEAQAAGFAEADPTLDVSGHDSAHKLAVLASLAFGAPIEFDRVHVEGIERIELNDLLAGRELGYVCKLLAVARREGDAIGLRVHPAFINVDHPLAAVSGAFNAVSVYGDAVGHTLFYGRGAGAMPTASAVVADLIEIGTGRAQPPVMSSSALTTPQYQPIDSLVTRYYLRMTAIDRPNVMAKIATVLGDHEISLRAVVQHEPPHTRADGAVPIVVTTHQAKESAVRDAVAEIAALDVVTERPVCIRVVDDLGE
jgi:homoserine dehydrogenase